MGIQNARLEAQVAGSRIVEAGKVELIVAGRVGHTDGFHVEVDVRFAAQRVRLQRRDGTAMRDGLHVVLIHVIRFEQSSLSLTKEPSFSNEWINLVQLSAANYGDFEVSKSTATTRLFRMIEPADLDRHGAAPRLPQLLDTADVRAIRSSSR